MPWYKKYLVDIWNVPNMLTLLRLLLIPVYVLLFAKGLMISAMCVFIAACLTDLLDGYLARKHNQVTAFGKLMDPLADKLMVITVMVTQVLAQRLPWAALAVVLIKELMMIMGSWLLVKYRDMVVSASPVGKVAQFAFCLGLALTFLHEHFTSWPVAPDRVVVWLAVGLTMFALFHYGVMAIQKLRFGKEEK